MAAKSPLALVKESFGDKTKLVQAIEKLTGDGLWIARTNKDKGLEHVSNAKLLKLHATFSEVKEKFGTREKLIDAILDLRKRAKDADLRRKLSDWPVPRLYDQYKSTVNDHVGTPVASHKPAEADAKASTRTAARATAVSREPKAVKKTAKKAATKTAKKTAVKKSARR